jgi:hypothetical protein
MNAIIKKNLGVFLLTGLIVLLYAGCSKEELTPGTANLDVSLKSSGTLEKSTAVYQEVNLDIQQVYYHASSGSAAGSGWFELETNAGIIDLLEDSIEKDTLLAFDSVLEAQIISQIRLVLGEQNTVKKDGQIYTLVIPSGQTSGIKVQVHAELEAGKSYLVQLDVNVEESILETGNGTFKFKPVIGGTVIEQEEAGKGIHQTASSPETGEE